MPAVVLQDQQQETRNLRNRQKKRIKLSVYMKERVWIHLVLHFVRRA
jgi:predicted DNA-binding protein (MmcQ/YjbR family)